LAHAVLWIPGQARNDITYKTCKYMIINEILYSLQAEGGLAGVPSVFVRLAGCPLRCRWCDTKYAWAESAGTEYTAEQVKETVESYPAKHLIITGGEPMTNAELNLKNVNRGKVFLMSQAVRLDEYLAKSKMTAELCKQTGFRFSPRLQVLLWDNERGR